MAAAVIAAVWTASPASAAVPTAGPPTASAPSGPWCPELRPPPNFLYTTTIIENGVHVDLYRPFFPTGPLTSFRVVCPT